MSESIYQAAFEARFKLNANRGGVNADCITPSAIIEFKEAVADVARGCGQLTAYMHQLQAKGEKVPRHAVLIDLTAKRAWQWPSRELLAAALGSDLYACAPSRAPANNTPHAAGFNYNTAEGYDRLYTMLHGGAETDAKYAPTPANIIMLAKHYYRAAPSGDKLTFMDAEGAEIRKPSVLADRLLPYAEPTNDAFSGVADCLNPSLWQKELGAFFTPPHAAALGQQFLQQAIAELPAGADYVVLDRCAGTGNLYRGLPTHILEHCYLSEIEPVQQQILLSNFADTGAHILPVPHDGLSSPFPAHEGLTERLAAGARLIIYENPPYAEAGAGNSTSGGGAARINSFKTSAMCRAMKAAPEGRGAATNDIANVFIWSAFNALHADRVIVFSPIKYWKNSRIVSPCFKRGAIVNRKGFHASEGGITLIDWAAAGTPAETLTLSIYDLPYANVGDGADEGDYLQAAREIANLPKVIVRRTLKAGALPSKAYPALPQGAREIVDVCGFDGAINSGGKKRVASYIAPEILGYMEFAGAAISPMNGLFHRACVFRGHGAYITRDNIMSCIPYFCACKRPWRAWHEKDVLMRQLAPKALPEQFITACAVWFLFTPKQKSRELTLTDGTLLQNETCPDERAWLLNAVAPRAVHAVQHRDFLKLRGVYERALAFIKMLPDYNPNTRYSVWEIEAEFNTYDFFGRTDARGRPIKSRAHPELHSIIQELKGELSAFWDKHIHNGLEEFGLVI